MKSLEQQLQASLDYVAQRKRAEAAQEERDRRARLWTDEELASVHNQIDTLLGDYWLRAMLRRRRA